MSPSEKLTKEIEDALNEHSTITSSKASRGFCDRLPAFIGLMQIIAMMVFALMLSYSLTLIERLQFTVEDNQARIEKLYHELKEVNPDAEIPPEATTPATF